MSRRGRGWEESRRRERRPLAIPEAKRFGADALRLDVGSEHMAEIEVGRVESRAGVVARGRLDETQQRLREARACRGAQTRAAALERSAREAAWGRGDSAPSRSSGK